MILYLHGFASGPASTKARYFVERAAKAGEPQSMNSLGACYARGEGVAVDEVAAVQWYRKSAEAGDPTGTYNLAVRMLTGQGVARDERLAHELLQRAAAQGLTEASDLLTKLGSKGR